MRSAFGCCCLVIALGAAAPLGAQTSSPVPAAAHSPFNVILPNYNSVGVGEIAGLEANAFVARADDSSAAWYNPAGLPLAKQNSVSGSAGIFQSVGVTPDNFVKSGTSFQQIPSMVSVVVRNLAGSATWAGGASISRTNAWAQYVDAERHYASGATADRVMYSSLGDFSQWMVNVGVGHTLGRTRIGMSLDGLYTDTERSETWSDQYQTGSALSAAVVQAHGYAWTAHLLGSFGVQYDLLPRLRVAAVIHTPGLRMLGGGSFNHEGMSQAGPTTTTASFFEPSSAPQYKVPLEFRAGAAWSGQRSQLEVDVLTRAGGGTYHAFDTSHTWTIITNPGSNGVPITQQPSFETPVIDSQAVVNVAVGGHVDLGSKGAWKLHGGFATDRSPVGPNDTYFTKVNLHVVTAGVSGRVKFLLGSLGVRYEAGSSDSIRLQPLENGLSFATRLKVSNLGVLYAVALLF